MTRPHPGWARRLMTEADEQFLAAVESLAALVAGGAAEQRPRTGRRHRDRWLDERLRALGLRVAMDRGGALLVEPELRAQAEEIRRLWGSRGRQIDDEDPALRSSELAASVEEMRRRLVEVDRAAKGLSRRR